MDRCLHCVRWRSLLLLAGCGKHQEHGASAVANLPVAKVRVAPAESKRQSVTEEVVGTVRAKIHATLEAKVSGRIQEMPRSSGASGQSGRPGRALGRCRR